MCDRCDDTGYVPFGLRWGLVGHTAPCPSCNPNAIVNQPPEEPTMITDAQARKIAADWHGGQGSALYALASTGAVRGDLVREINRDVCDPLFQSDADITDLQSLLTYARLNRGRGPVDGWSRLWPE